MAVGVGVGVKEGVSVGLFVAVEVEVAVGVQVDPTPLVTALESKVAGWVSKLSSSAMLTRLSAHWPGGKGATVTPKERVPDAPAAR